MAKVLRIKRELNCEPLDAVVVNCKRRKIDDGDVPIENVSTVLKFAGTANTQVLNLTFKLLILTLAQYLRLF